MHVVDTPIQLIRWAKVVDTDQKSPFSSLT